MKKTKKKKSAVAMLAKRKSFMVIFLQRWIPVVILSVIIFMLVMENIITSVQDIWENSYYWSKDAIIETIDAGPKNESNEFYLNRVKFAMAQRQELGTASLLYNAETGEIIADSEEQIFWLQKREDDSSLVYTCSTKDIEGWEKYREEFVKHKDGYYSLYEDTEMKHIYIKDSNFIPGEFTVTNKAFEDEFDVGEVVLTTKFEEPKNLSSDYVKTELDDNWSLSVIWGYHKNDTSEYASNDMCYEELQKKYKSNMEVGSEHDNNYRSGIFYTEYKIIVSGENEVTMPTGEKAILLTVLYYDAWDEFGTRFIIAAVLTFIVGLVVSFIWARLSFVKLKAQYDMEDYRKTLMNNMAHDLNSPLMSISGYAENLQNNINTDKREHYADAILENVNYMNRIIESVLTLGKTENEKIVLKKEKCSIANLVNECDKKYDLQRKEKNLKLIIEGDGVLEIDVSLFTQAIDNLMGNAIKYASDNSTINVVINGVAMSITNNCDKMPEVDIDTLCEAYVVGNENRSNRSGSGLGLAIVKNVCTLHKYGFEVKCEKNEFVAKIIFSKKKH